jgi:hypothetical protein
MDMSDAELAAILSAEMAQETPTQSELANLSAFVTEQLLLQPPVVFAIHGKAGSGKSYLAHRISCFLQGSDEGANFPEQLLAELKKLHDRRSVILAFSDTLKEHLYATEKLDTDYLTRRRKSVQVRKLLTGTADAARAKYGSEYFAKLLQARIHMMLDNQADVFIVQDLRYRHQKQVLDSMRDSGFHVIRITVNAPKRSGADALEASNFDFVTSKDITTHDSETDLDAETATQAEAEKNGFIWFPNDSSA